MLQLSRKANIVKRIVTALIVVLLSLNLSSPDRSYAGSNGQQIRFNACGTRSVTIEGTNQYNQRAVRTVATNPLACGYYNIYGWWWKGATKLTGYYDNNVSTVIGLSIVTSQRSDWVTLSIPQPAAQRIAGSQIVSRGKIWVDARVPYNQSAYRFDPSTRRSYRQDCSGFVSYAWSLPTSANTASLSAYAIIISYDQLAPGDILNNGVLGNNGHTVLFVRWVDKNQGIFTAYEENAGYNGAVQTTLKINTGTGELRINGTLAVYDPGTKFFAQRHK